MPLIVLTFQDSRTDERFKDILAELLASKIEACCLLSFAILRELYMSMCL